MGIVDDVTNSVNEQIDVLNELNPAFKVLLSFVFTAIGYYIIKYAVVRPWGRVVMSTDTAWDDKLHRPVANRAYFFLFVGAAQLSLIWVSDQASFNDDISSYFSAIYILTATSIASVSIKHIIPMVMDRFTEKSSVTVSGSNPLITFTLRFVVWFGGTYLALTEIGVELVGVLASLAVFSLIIGLAVQQTLGNIINSFLLAIDRPFEIGDRIEVDGTWGSVVGTGILSTKVLDRDERLVVIPNNTLVSSTIVNHARGGGDGMARRISIVIDVGVDYRENTEHVKLTMIKVARDCEYVLDEPKPQVLLTELGDFAKVFRLFGWVNDYSDEWLARDWLLRTIDSTFSNEGINIPYPTSVELTESVYTQASTRKQAAASKKMEKEEQKHLEEREETKILLEGIQEELKDVNMDKKKRAELEEEARRLETVINMFDAAV
ncbi:MAG: mechanosensitive ion channel family protein [Euryarchaeota archaeon]|jgi:small-conductance mechanosensitive channel|nr:mechanosensitive ion channel family protein [Euryarchaeota archaeon]MBT7986727.1 mechanosensitive ion channel family protein [Euryarchaeota archaeon]